MPNSDLAGVRLSQDDKVILAAIGKEDVTWRSDMGGRITYRLWETETEAFVVTRRLKVFVAAGLAKRWDGYAFGRGGVELTDTGKKAIS